MGLRKKKSLVDQATDYLDAVKPHVEAAFDTAVDFAQHTALPALSEAKDKAIETAGPILVDAKDKAVPVLQDARAKAAPYVAQGAAYAADQASTARALAETKVAELQGKPAPKRKSKLLRLALVAGVAGGVVVVAKKLQGGKTADNWQSSYTPAPAPTPVAKPTVAPTPAAPQAGLEEEPEDVAGATPDEAIADAAETPSPVTTPDEPAEVVEIDPKK